RGHSAIPRVRTGPRASPAKSAAPPGRDRHVASCLDSGLIAARGLLGLRLRCAWAGEQARRRVVFPHSSSSRGRPARADAPWVANSLTDARYRQAGASFPRPERTGGPGPSCRRTVTVARILIAEDEDAIRSLIARALRQDGHEVVTAIDGARALDVLAREKGAF